LKYITIDEVYVDIMDMDFWRRAERPSRILKVRNEVIREIIGVTQTILEIMENNILKL
jgi:hypothetical protein